MSHCCLQEIINNYDFAINALFSLGYLSEISIIVLAHAHVLCILPKNRYEKQIRCYEFVANNIVLVE